MYIVQKSYSSVAIYFRLLLWYPIAERTQRKPMNDRCSFWYSHMRKSLRTLCATSFHEPPRTILRFIM